jgi:hypothetical protein
MRWIDGLSRAQRVVVVIALGLALDTVGNYLVALGQGAVSVGWYSYAPLTASLSAPTGGLHHSVRVIIWLVLIGLWALGSVRVLRASSDNAASG